LQAFDIYASPYLRAWSCYKIFLGQPPVVYNTWNFYMKIEYCKRKDLIDKYRLRVNNCICTIIDVHKIVSVKYESKDLLTQFEKLKKAVEHLDMSLVREGDVLMVEQATNALLGEFKPFFESKKFSFVYEQQKN